MALHTTPKVKKGPPIKIGKIFQQNKKNTIMWSCLSCS
jgi:hypothetical protein